MLFLSLLRKKGLLPPRDLLEQLSFLLAFQKDESMTATAPMPNQLAELAALDGLSHVKGLISKMMTFRNGLNRDELFDKSLEGLLYSKLLSHNLLI